MMLQPDGKLLVTGSFTTFSGISRIGVARLNSNGSLDTSFVANVTQNSIVSTVAFRLQSNGQIIIGGLFDRVNNISRLRLARLNIDGSLDQTFAPVIDQNSSSAGYTAPSFILPDQKIIIIGSFTFANQTIRFGMAKLNPDGTTDASFTLNAKGYGFINASAVQPDGKILVGGLFSHVNGLLNFGVARLNPDGTVDSSFNSGIGFFKTTELIGGTINGYVRAIAVQNDGKILLGGDFATYNNIGRGNLVRVNSNGTLDSSFLVTSSSVVHDIVVQPDNKIIVAGGGIARYNVDGTLDANFSSGAGVNDTIRSVVVQPDGKIIIGGFFTRYNNLTRNRIARLNPNGSLDTGFDTSIGANTFIWTTGLQVDGKILVGGGFTSINGTTRNRIARLSSDGTLDATFDPGTGADSPVYKILIQPNGKIFLGGGFTNFAGVSRKKLVEILPNGALDTNFGANLNWFAPGTFGASIYTLTQTNSGLMVGGNFSNVDSRKTSGFVKLKLQKKSYFDYDGDGKTDLSIFRPAPGEWWYLRSSDGGNRAFQFGSSTDKIVPADYTGDGKTDLAFWKPSTGEWFVLRSEDSSFYGFPFGAAGDVPVPADYDGDGKTDAAVFRESSLTWFINKSSGGTDIVGFGAAGDKPTVADYDGDGRSDIAIYRPNGANGGEWWIRRSSNGSVLALQFGSSTDKPVQGDYTGDGKTDVALWRPSNANWFILRSEDLSFYAFPFGTAGDIPVAGDYDGDGRFDAGVFRPSSTNWFIQRSTAGTLIQQFGVAGDLPTPSAFVP